jgi:hypothetical protein
VALVAGLVVLVVLVTGALDVRDKLSALIRQTRNISDQ